MKQKMSFLKVGTVLVTVLLTGCASIVGSRYQTVAINTETNDVAVKKAQCELTNNKGAWNVEAPGSVVLHKSTKPLYINCESDGVKSPEVQVDSKFSPLFFGNILFGGIIGLVVDAVDGAGFKYPKVIDIDMKEGLLKPNKNRHAANATPRRGR